MTRPKTNLTPPTERSFLRGEGWMAGIVSFVLFTVFLFSVAVVPIRSDNDCWWHVKAGDYIREHGIPKYDVFAYTAADHVWNNHEWLTQVLFSHAWSIGNNSGFGGWRAVVLFVAIILWGCYGIAFFLASRLSGSFWIGLLIAVCAVAIGRRMFYPRPPVVSNLFMMLEIALLVAVNQRWVRREWIFALIPFIALWSNLHGGWMAGGFILGAWMLDQVVKIIWRRYSGRADANAYEVFPLAWLVVLGAGCALATLANPFGFELYKLPARVMSDKALVSQIGELAPPDYHYVIDFLIFSIILALLTATTALKNRPVIWEFLIAIFFLYQAVSHVRHLFLFSVAMVPLAARVFAAAAAALDSRLIRWRIAKRPGNAANASACAGIWLACWVLINPLEGGQWLHPFTIASYPGRNAQYAAGNGYMKDRFPTLLCDLIDVSDLHGNMFNENNYAGYLIWRFSPEKHRVFSDSRFDIFGSKFLLRENIISAGGAAMVDGKEETWKSLLDLYDIQWAITRTGAGLSDAFREAKTWDLAALWGPDFGGWEIWIRQSSENADMLARMRAAAPMAMARAPDH